VHAFRCNTACFMKQGHVRCRRFLQGPEGRVCAINAAHRGPSNGGLADSGLGKGKWQAQKSGPRLKADSRLPLRFPQSPKVRDCAINCASYGGLDNFASGSGRQGYGRSGDFFMNA
jgi:hypothetical protein